MKWASAISLETDTEAAVQQACADLLDQLDGAPIDLLVMFVSNDHKAGFLALPGLLKTALGSFGELIGCSAGGVIGGGQEVEAAPALSLTAASLPSVELTSFYLTSDDLPPKGASDQAWVDLLGVDQDIPRDFLLLPDPLTFDVMYLVNSLDEIFPDSVKVGGLASGGRIPGSNAIYCGDKVADCGAVGLVMSGDIVVETIVAQGCRPVGVPMFTTRCHGNMLQELDGQPPAELLSELYATLSPEDQTLFRQALFLGVVMDSNASEYGRGDFLIRNLLGIDPASGSIAVGAHLEERQVVQFHLRDAATSREDLRSMIDAYADRDVADEAVGCLLFSCLGRGQHLYGAPNHDSDLLRARLGEIAIGGFFCSGEIGPVRGTTFLHGYTSSFGLFRPKTGC
jgi:small ligand-binding sensory domain FIST